MRLSLPAPHREWCRNCQNFPRFLKTRTIFAERKRKNSGTRRPKSGTNTSNSKFGNLGAVFGLKCWPAWRRFSFPARRAKTQPVLHIKIQFFLRAKRREVCRFVMEWQKKKICFGLMFFERKIIFILFPYMLLIWLTVKNLLMLRSHMSM